MAILVIRIAGRCKMNKKNEETLKRLKLYKKYSARMIDDTNKVMMGMVEAVRDEVAFGKIDPKLEKEIKEKRGKADSEMFALHPPRGGFKKSTKTRYPQGIRGKNPNIAKFAEKML
jgi:ribosomal protein L30/L7E